MPILGLLLAACASGPDYRRPPVDVPLAYKEDGPWETAQPQAADSTQPWWERYRDPVLTALIAEADRANQNIRQAEAQYRQAKALSDQARAGLLPTVGLNAGAQRARANGSGATRTLNADSVGLTASWEPDLWGSVRRSIEAGDASRQASADDLAAARLSLRAALTQDYLQLRIVDRLRDLYAATTAAYARSLRLTQSQYRAGVALRSDVALAESQLATARAQGVDLELQRAQLEHAIAILTGKAPAAFALSRLAAGAPVPLQLPTLPAGLPSALLERRPDIAAAERRMVVANANIGVARAANYPHLVLGASGGFSSARIDALFDTPGRVWALGATLAQTLFDGGLRQARSEQAVAAYDASVAQYKQTVLSSFQQVEDSLAALRLLDQEMALQDQAVQAGQLAERLALSQYRAGTASYLSVVTAQALSLANQRSAVQLQGRRLAASVLLLTAVGGGWDPGLPSHVPDPQHKASS